jgi:DNA processing protein
MSERREAGIPRERSTASRVSRRAASEPFSRSSERGPSGPAPKAPRAGSMKSSRPSAPHLDAVQVAAATLACLPSMTPVRLRRVLERWDGPIGALAAIKRGHATTFLRDVMPPKEVAHAGEVARAWQSELATDRIPRLLAERAPFVYMEGTPNYPIAGAADAPAVLLAEGGMERALGQPRVAVVGTRAATPHGLADAYEVGGALARAGVTVVSGLAIGIDAAAHEGALAAGGLVVGVVATGLDVVYPRRHSRLFERVRAAGLLVSELGYGVGPRREAFPIRNRIIAGLADVVAVVEATERGGARITAERAAEYGRTVLAQPGSRRNPAAVGTNALLADGAQPFVEPDDILIALGLTPGGRRRDHRPRPQGDAAAALRACGGEPATFDQLASRTGLSLDALVVAVRALEHDGWIERSRGLCWPR